ncbi:hypothetical protein BDY17DRAFT_298014 [Neohortaea acidophila]|uniref:Uncharacterized protein n=1 Tax=Neohortaea acidophila TaxID=245834 RepID=A0A6A6PUF8_9PEZI|nr:uncharacterized protein BDY17DRAFT_298014 [Neohortaea acidophila]KAF2483749.1 hypothetical protein BDY17DRAFT_298014 [Neohortaea acidophila]
MCTALHRTPKRCCPMRSRAARLRAPRHITSTFENTRRSTTPCPTKRTRHYLPL